MVDYVIMVDNVGAGRGFTNGTLRKGGHTTRAYDTLTPRRTNRLADCGRRWRPSRTLFRETQGQYLFQFVVLHHS
jgi:hypothetical protein